VSKVVDIMLRTVKGLGHGNLGISESMSGNVESSGS